jgi:SAP domain-containing ribonucleoprotein
LDEEEFGIVEAPAEGAAVEDVPDAAPDVSVAFEEKPLENTKTTETAAVIEKEEEPSDPHHQEQPDPHPPKITTGMSFTEKMAQRAKRFGLPLSDDVKKELRKERFNQMKKSEPKAAKRESGGGGGSSPKKQKQQPVKNQQQKQQQSQQSSKAEAPLLPKEEIEKRLARAEKFGKSEGVDELKAMLRKYRFQS